ncbi:MAG: hypothetical protein MSG64_06125 [Pyrinomonadaceae bacterium MAG19_C2-C3]|nr:hypothetical protein [Pyrinomonadaceae bacterium MAG19_C2-C3]
MKKYGVFIIVLIMFILQVFLIVSSSRANERFYERMRQDTTALNERLREEGMPPNQVASITSTLKIVQFNVSSYVHQSSTITILGMLPIAFLSVMIATGIAARVSDKSEK